MTSFMHDPLLGPKLYYFHWKVNIVAVQEEKVDINLLDGDEATPLHFAASRGHVDTVGVMRRHDDYTLSDCAGEIPALHMFWRWLASFLVMIADTKYQTILNSSLCAL